MMRSNVIADSTTSLTSSFPFSLLRREPGHGHRKSAREQKKSVQAQSRSAGEDRGNLAAQKKKFLERRRK